MIQDHSEIEIECEQCGKFFVSRKELRDHRQKHNKDKSDTRQLNKLLEGLLNDKKCLSEEMQASEDQESNPVFKCDSCNDKFIDKQSLKNNEQTLHQKKNLKLKKPSENLQKLCPN